MKIKVLLSSFSRFSLSLLLLPLFILQPVAFAQAPARGTRVLTNDQKIRQVLSRLTFGARPGDVEMVRKIGIKAFIDRQLAPGDIDDAEMNRQIGRLGTLNLATPALIERYISPKPEPTPEIKTSAALLPGKNPVANAPKSAAFPPEAVRMTEETPPAASAPAKKPLPQPNKPQQIVTELQRSKLLRAVYSDRQLYEVIVDFWENHFNIFVNKNADLWLMTSFDRESVRPFALGRFRDLLGSVARSPAMLFYLDNWQSSVVKNYPATRDSPARRTGGINENYARELLELHTLGINGGYTQKDVQEVARCFTGWTIRKPDSEGTFIYDPSKHDNEEKTVLGQKVPAGGGIADAELVMDILAKHPSTARFIATKLARRFLGDNPPPAAINEAARVYLRTDGSIRETLRSIVTSPYLFDPSLYQSKTRTPFEFVAASLRMTGARTDAGRPMLDWLSRMGQPVFSYRSPEGFPESGAESLSHDGLLNRINFTIALVTNQIKGTNINTKVLLGGVDPNKPTDVASYLMRVVLMNDALPGTRSVLYKIARAPARGVSNTSGTAIEPLGGSKAMEPAITLIILTLGTPEFQRK